MSDTALELTGVRKHFPLRSLAHYGKSVHAMDDVSFSLPVNCWLTNLAEVTPNQFSIEGVAFSMRDCFSLLRGAGLGSVSEVRIAGGGAKGALWRRIVASALGLPMVTVNSTEVAAYGAALLAGVGAGAWPSVESACDATVSITGRDEPAADWAKAYDDLYPRYRGLYAALKPTYDALPR